MRFGLAMPNFRELASPEFIRRFSVRAEELGYDSLWAADHIVVPNEVAEQFGSTFYEPLTTLAYIAGMTHQIRLGVSAIVVPYRNPVHQAKVIATIDALSGGRATIAVAAGWSKEEMAVLGAPFHRRGAVTNEYLRLFRELWTNRYPRFEGKFVQVDGVTFAPRPVQDPLPLWGAGNSAAAIRRAARYCQGWHPRRRIPDELREGVALLHAEADKAGREEKLDVAVRVPVTFGGTAGADLFPLRGGANDISAVVDRYRDAGATHLILDTFGAAEVGDGTPDQVIETIERFAADVMPRFSK